MQFQFRERFEPKAPKKLQFQDVFMQSLRRFSGLSADFVVLTDLFTQSMSCGERAVWDKDLIYQSLSYRPWGKQELLGKQKTGTGYLFI